MLGLKIFANSCKLSGRDVFSRSKLPDTQVADSGQLSAIRLYQSRTFSPDNAKRDQLPQKNLYFFCKMSQSLIESAGHLHYMWGF